MRSTASIWTLAPIPRSRRSTQAFHRRDGALIGGPTVFVKLAEQGVPVRIFGTGLHPRRPRHFRERHRDQVARRSERQATRHRHGRLAVPGAENYTTAKGIDLGKDITVVNANFAVARAQLEAGRVDAALVIEPLASIIFKQHPDWHSIFNGAEGWKEITGEAGWEIVPAMRADSSQNSKAPQMLLAALAGHRGGIREEHRGSGQDRERDLEAPARHSDRRGREQAAANDRQARLGAGGRRSRSPT